jgi:hypothetical protein
MRGYGWLRGYEGEARGGGAKVKGDKSIRRSYNPIAVFCGVGFLLAALGDV